MLELNKTTENTAANNGLQGKLNKVEKHITDKEELVKTSFFIKSSLLEQAKAKAKEEDLTLKQYLTKLVKKDLDLL